jgi:hypothetical protein
MLSSAPEDTVAVNRLIIPGAAALALAVSCGQPVTTPTTVIPPTPEVEPVPTTFYTLAFGNLPADGTTVTTYPESGFTITTSRTNWFSRTTYGNPAPSLQFMSPAGVRTEAALSVTVPGGAFTFVSVDLYSSTTPIPYRIEGQRRSTQSYALNDTLPQSAMVPNTYGRFATVTNSQPDLVVDTLIIVLTNDAAACCSNPMGIDNLILKR